MENIQKYKYLLEIQYLGAAYHGWQAQANETIEDHRELKQAESHHREVYTIKEHNLTPVEAIENAQTASLTRKSLPTIQGTLEKKLAVVLRYPVTLYVAGRTDAGVHARQQFAHFEAPHKLDYATFLYSINGLLKGREASENHTIAVKNIKLVAPDFHARFSCIQKTYAYYILPNKTRDIFHEGKYWHLQKIRDINEFVNKANECAQFLLGTHDFASFQDADCQAKSSLKTIDACKFEIENNMIKMSISARSFLQHQIRITIGTIYEIVSRNLSPHAIKEILDMRDRKKAGMTAPACGLFLEKIEY